MSRTGQMGRRPLTSQATQVTKTHDERRATEPLMLSLYGRGWRSRKCASVSEGLLRGESNVIDAVEIVEHYDREGLPTRGADEEDV
jgi:hypothetical protein